MRSIRGIPIEDHDEVCSGGALPVIGMLFAVAAAIVLSVVAVCVCVAFNMRGQLYWMLIPASFALGLPVGLAFSAWLYKPDKKRVV
mgnify:FL=1